METRAHHVIIGAFAIGVFAAALFFVLWLSKSSIDRQFDLYDIVFNEAVTGLSKGGTVQYNGIKVGEVAQLSLAKDDPRRIVRHEVYFEGDPPTGFGRLRDVVMGPDHELYVTTSNCDGRGQCPKEKDEILRITRGGS